MGFEVTFLTLTKRKIHILQLWAVHHLHYVHLKCHLNTDSKACPQTAKLKFLVNIYPSVGLYWSRSAGVSVSGRFPEQEAMRAKIGRVMESPGQKGRRKGVLGPIGKAHGLLLSVLEMTTCSSSNPVSRLVPLPLRLIFFSIREISVCSLYKTFRNRLAKRKEKNKIT